MTGEELISLSSEPVKALFTFLWSGVTLASFQMCRHADHLPYRLMFKTMTDHLPYRLMFKTMTDGKARVGQIRPVKALSSVALTKKDS